MKYPNLTEEKRLWKNGYRTVVGLDEAGRGALAGPVVAAATVIKNYKIKIENLKSIKDSKKLSPRQRERAYELITKDKGIQWGIGVVSEKVIDRINVLEATKLAMEKAVKNLVKKIRRRSSVRNFHDRVNFAPVSFLILDGNFRLGLSLPQKSIIRADEKVFSCAAASVLAKVTRDRIMIRYHQKYPRYRFDLHKGYGTKLHLQRLKKYGCSRIHRLSFAPVRDKA
ncbi:MAG: ribonuclease HII [bacterium]|nr:ribonuclease HII [bacterium]